MEKLKVNQVEKVIPQWEIRSGDHKTNFYETAIRFGPILMASSLNQGRGHTRPRALRPRPNLPVAA